MKYGGHNNTSTNKTESDFCNEIRNQITKDNANTTYKDSTYEDVTSYLTCAAKSGSVDICQELIDNGANVNFQDNTGKTALIHAAMRGSVDICQKLIDNGANVNARDNTGNTALMHAVQFPLNENEDNKINCFSLLIENGASFDNTIVDEIKKSTFYMACENFMIKCVELLFLKGYKMSENDKNVLFSVIGNFASEIQKMNKTKKLEKIKIFFKFLKFLLDNGASATGTTTQNPIKLATDSKMTEIADLLKHKSILDSLQRAEFEVKHSDGTVSIEESKQKLREIEKELGINDKSINEIGDYLKEIKSFIKAYISLKGGKRIKNKRSNKNKRSQKTKSRNFRKTRHRSRV